MAAAGRGAGAVMPVTRPGRPRRIWLFALAGLAAIVALLSCFYNPFVQVEGGSMFPELWDGDVLLVNLQAYRWETPQRGDVVVFRQGGAVLVKRMIGLPGDLVEVRRQRVIVNGVPQAEPYASASEWMSAGPMGRVSPDFGPIQVPAESYFLLGDNRARSLDSRIFGPVPRSALMGRVEAVWSPWARRRWLR